MIDIYHFSNPLSADCLTTAQCLQSIALDITESIQLYFVPLIDINFITKLENKAIDLTEQDSGSIDNIVTVFNVILDFKAAQLEGNKKARHFLIQLQHELIVNKQPYTRQLVKKLITGNGINYSDFLTNRVTDEAISAIIKDQKFAQKTIQNSATGIAVEFSEEQEINVLTDFSVNDLVLSFAPHFTPNINAEILLENIKQMNIKTEAIS